jgi:hypothetical protein
MARAAAKARFTPPRSALTEHALTLSPRGEGSPGSGIILPSRSKFGRSPKGRKVIAGMLAVDACVVVRNRANEVLSSRGLKVA